MVVCTIGCAASSKTMVTVTNSATSPTWQPGSGRDQGPGWRPRKVTWDCTQRKVWGGLRHQARLKASKGTYAEHAAISM